MEFFEGEGQLGGSESREWRVERRPQGKLIVARWPHVLAVPACFSTLSFLLSPALLAFGESGRQDLNLRPLDPQSGPRHHNATVSHGHNSHCDQAIKSQFVRKRRKPLFQGMDYAPIRTQYAQASNPPCSPSPAVLPDTKSAILAIVEAAQGR